MLRLVTIPISHFCEKARWALDRAGISYREERHVQGIHVWAARRAGGGTTAPVLVTPDRVIAQSQEILAWADERTPPKRRLFPADAAERAEVDRLCRRFDHVLGPHGRRLMYVHILTAPEQMLPWNNQGVPRWEAQAIRRAWPVTLRWANRRLGIRPGCEVEDEAKVWRELDFVAGLLEDGRQRLCGERFTAADLTFAALAASVVIPPVYGVPLPPPDALPAPMEALVERVREHPAGRYALTLFTECRPSPATTATPAPSRSSA